MNKTVLVILAILGGIGLFIGGAFVGRANSQAIQPGWMMDNFQGQHAPDMMNASGMMGNWGRQTGPGMMNSSMMGMMMNGANMMGSGMMGGGMMNGQSGYGMMSGNMMGNLGYTPDTEINVTADEAVAIAQDYLDETLPGKTADDHADAFPGYYTLHVLEDGEIVGMLSVNAASGQVFLHHWHGDFVEMSE